MKRLLSFVLLLLVFKLYDFSSVENEIEDYIRIVTVYFKQTRNVRLLTHISCFSQSENAKISLAMSRQNVQSRFVVELEKIELLIDTPNNTVQGFVVNMNCDRFERIFYENDDQAIIFRGNNLWLFIDNNIHMDINDTVVDYKSKFNEFNALPLSDLFIATRIEQIPMQWILFDAYKVDYDYDIVISQNGLIEASTNDTATVSGSNFFANRRKNLNGISLPCGFVIAYPEKFTYVEDPMTNHIDTFTKASVKLGENLLEDLNMSCQILQTDSYGWPRNGTFDGVMGLFQKKKIRMASHGINMRVERLQFTDFTGNIFTPRTPLILRQPALTTVANIFVLPLASEVWICIFILVVVIIGLMTLQLIHPLLKSSITPYDVVTFILGAFCQQGTHLHIPTTSGRFIVLTTFLATLALFTSYSATIVALLQSPSNYIKTLDDLIASPMKVAIHEAGYAHFSVKSNFSGISEIYRKKIQPQGDAGWIYEPFVGIEKVRTQLFGFIVDCQSAYKAIQKTYTESEKCSIKEIQVIVLPATTILVEKNSGYKELLRQRLTWQKDVGLMKREEVRWIPKKPECRNTHAFVITVDLNIVEPAIVLLLVGYTLSIVVVLLEWVYYKFCNRFQGISQGNRS